MATFAYSGRTRAGQNVTGERMAESMDAAVAAAIPPIVNEHGGEVDRLIGDSIMATWGTRGDQPDHAPRAVAGALALQRPADRPALG